jgi:hypothetical protein
MPRDLYWACFVVHDGPDQEEDAKGVDGPAAAKGAKAAPKPAPAATKGAKRP